MTHKLLANYSNTRKSLGIERKASATAAQCLYATNDYIYLPSATAARHYNE
jgi:hypothetical protein